MGHKYIADLFDLLTPQTTDQLMIPDLQKAY